MAMAAQAIPKRLLISLQPTRDCPMVMIMVGAAMLGIPPSSLTGGIPEHDVFGDEKNNTIRYKTACGLSSNGILVPTLTALQMSWQAVSVLMIAEIVSNGMLSLPGALAVVGVSEPVSLNPVSGLPGSSISLAGRSRRTSSQTNYPEMYQAGRCTCLMMRVPL
jgi:hypothetical protein